MTSTKPQEPSLENTVQLHLNGDDCNCPELESLWDKMKKVDELALECSKYGDLYIEDPTMNDDKTFMKDFHKKVQTWINEIKDYADIFADLCMDGGIGIKAYKENDSEKKPFSLKKAYYESLIMPESTKNLIYEVYCNNCGTEIPRIDYPDWKF